MIECQVLGPVAVTVAGGHPPPELLWRKHLALLVYLARSPRRSRTRDHLIGLLWSDKPEPAARHSLNEALRVIRRAAGEEALETRVEQVTLSPDAVQLDLDRFEALAAAGDLAGAAALMTGEFMEGFGVPGAPGFEDWLAAERRHWNDRGVKALAAHSGKLAAAGRLDAAVDLAERATTLDPVSDVAMSALMRSLALRGDRASALGRYQAYRSQLELRLGSVPPGAAEQLASRIRRDRSHRQPPPERTAAAARRRVPLMGRTQELGRLQSAWEECHRERRPHLMMLLGDSGIGRTRLLQELLDRAELDGGVTPGLRAVPADREEPGAGLIALASGGLLEAPGLAGAPPAALATFARRLPEWHSRFPSSADQAPLPPGRALGEVLRAIGTEAPVLLWVDDAQWLDSDSLGGLGALLRDASETPLLLLVSAATAPSRAELDDLRTRIGRDIPGEVLTLRPLDATTLRQMVAWAFPGYSENETERLTRRLSTDSAGLPLLVVELLDAVASGLELEGGGAWPREFHTLDQTLPGDLPNAVVAAVRIGFRRLSPDAQSVLSAASVLGDRVSRPELARAAALEAVAVDAALDELEWTRWLVAEPRGYSFVARITREVIARDLLTPGQRLRIRGRAGASGDRA